MTENAVINKNVCYHCGEDCHTNEYAIEEKHFCCHGCKSVYQVLSENKLCSYYNFNNHPGATQKNIEKRFDYLSEPAIISNLIDYTDNQITIVTFYIPYIHCSSCLWLLEQLNRINPAVHNCRVDFLKKQLNVRFDHKKLNMQALVQLLYNIGYEPLISLQDVIKKQNETPKDNLVLKLAVAGFCFGNVMLLSFPEYFGLSVYEHSFRIFFGILNILFSIPVVFYSGQGYFVAAWQNLRSKVFSIDFPLALGILVLFIRTVFDVMSQTGAGFADTLCGLVFFLLIGKFVQQKTYHHISFERDYRSFFPVSVQIIDKDSSEHPIPLSELKTNHRMIIRNNEIIPADSILLKGEALIDFSFVTGESMPVTKTLGEIVYAGGRQTGEAIEMEVIKPVSQSYLTQLWNNEAFKNKKGSRIQTFNQKVSKYFTIVLLTVAIGAFLFWLPTDLNRGIAAFTAVLIIACPCALALSTPFTMAAALSIFDKNLFYLKNTAVVEQMAGIDSIVFDKTGTITNGENNNVAIEADLSDYEKQLIFGTCVNSIHPLSRMICRQFAEMKRIPISEFREIAGLGLTAFIDGHHLKLGSSKFIFGQANEVVYESAVHIMLDEKYLGYFSIKHNYRHGMDKITELSVNYPLYILSGDYNHEQFELVKFFKTPGSMHFNQSPQDKLNFIQYLQKQGSKVMMVGDGLNDSGALKQSDMGVAVTDNVNNFSPGSDAILDGKSFQKLPAFLRFSKDTVKIIHSSFLLSLTYNLVGLSFAVSGKLSPIIAAILMPLSTVTIISFTSIATHIAAKKQKLL